MKANELRIGNLVSVKKNHREYLIANYDIILDDYLKVSATAIDTCYLFIKYDDDGLNEYDFVYGDLEPIPITEDWLLKLGFKKHENIIGSYTKTPKGTTEPYGFRFHTQYPHKHGRGKFNNVVDVYYFESILNIKGGVKFIHQLQNLYFALTSQELKFNKI